MRPILTFPSRFVSSWPQSEKEGSSVPVAGEELDSLDALNLEFRDDRYFVCYSPIEGEPGWRFRKGSQLAAQNEGKEIECGWVAIDVDYPGKQTTDEYRETINAWVLSLRECEGEPLGCWFAYYQTPGGWRLLFRLSRPVDPQEQESISLFLRARLSSLGVETDDQCSDWTRLFRVPHAMYGDSGKATTDIVDPSTTTFEEAVLEVTPEMVAAKAAPSGSSASTHRQGEFAGEEAPDPDEFLPTVQGARNGFRKESGVGDSIRWTLKKLKADLNGLCKNDQKKKRLAEALETIRDQEPILVERNSTINRLAMYAASRCKGKKGVTVVRPEDVFAFLAVSLNAMDEAPDSLCAPPGPEDRGPTWWEHGWHVACEMASKVNEEIRIKQTRAADEEKAQEEATRETIKTVVEVQINDFGLERVPEEDRAGYLEQFALLKIGQKYHVLTKDGVYSATPVPKEGLYNALVNAGNPLSLPLLREDSRGNTVRRKPSDIAADFSIEATRINYRFNNDVSRGMSVRVVSNSQQEIEVEVTVDAACWNPEVVNSARYDPDVAEFLYNLCSDREEYLRLQCWLAHFMDLNKFLPMLLLAPASRSGKSLLIQGLEDLYNEESITRSLIAELGYSTGGRREGGNLHRNNPLYKAEEGVVRPTIGDNRYTHKSKQAVAKAANGLASKIKDLATSSSVSKKKLYQDDEVTYRGTPRLVVASNDQTDLAVLIGAWDDESEEDSRMSMMNRILGVQCGPRATEWLVEKGDYMVEAAWAKQQHPYKHRADFEQWFDSRESRYAIARHVVWLNNRRQQGGHGNIDDFEDTSSLVPYLEMLTRPDDVLLSIKPTQHMRDLIAQGGDLRSRFFDLLVGLAGNCFGGRDSKGPQTDGSKGIYYCQDMGVMLVSQDVLFEMYERVSDDPTPKSTKIANFKSWGLSPIETSKDRILVSWERQQIPINTAGLWAVSTTTMKARARSAGNEFVWLSVDNCLNPATR